MGPVPRAGRVMRGVLGRVGLAIVHGRSMHPTMREGDRLLVVYGLRPRPGRPVLVRLPGGPLAVKRLIAADPAGWWVERDNPVEGVDSWAVGAIPPGDLVAVVLFRLWPWPSRLSPPSSR